MIRSHVLLVVHSQQALDVLGICHPDLKAQIPDVFLGLAQMILIRLAAAAFRTDHDSELPSGSSPGLDIIQMDTILPQQFPYGWQFLLLQTQTVPVLVAAEGLPGVQGQHLHLRHRAEQPSQCHHPAPDTILRKHG